jgi:hypothetical protein
MDDDERRRALAPSSCILAYSQAKWNPAEITWGAQGLLKGWGALLHRGRCVPSAGPARLWPRAVHSIWPGGLLRKTCTTHTTHPSPRRTNGGATVSRALSWTWTVSRPRSTSPQPLCWRPRARTRHGPTHTDSRTPGNTSMACLFLTISP